MRRIAKLVALGLALLSVACVAPPNVSLRALEDFSQARTWNWLPRDDPRVVVEQRPQSDLDRGIAASIEGVLSARGFRRSRGPADFYVTYHLAIARRDVAVAVPFAARSLPSFKEAGGYVVQGTEMAIRTFDDTYLLIGFTRGGDRMTWTASLEQRVRGPFEYRLGDSVALLLESFPDHRPVESRDGGLAGADCVLAQTSSPQVGAAAAYQPALTLDRHSPEGEAGGGLVACPGA